MLKNVQMARASASHPYQAHRIQDLPERLLPLAQAFIPPDESLSLIFAVPYQAFLGEGKHSTQGIPEQALVFTSEGAHYLRASKDPRKEGTHTWILGKDLLYVRWSLILLYGELEVVGVVDGALVRFNLIYNTVADELLIPSLQRLLRMAWTDEAGGDFAAENEKLVHPIRARSHKFGNGLSFYGLQPGERLLGAVFQEGIWRKLFLGIEYQVRPPVLVALSEKQLILLEEERLQTQANYGWIFTFISRGILQHLEIIPAKKGVLIRAHLKRDGVETTLQTRLDAEAAHSLTGLWQAQGWEKL